MGIASRRKAEELIRNKQVRINGKLATIGQRIDPSKDTINVGQKRLKKLPPLIYLLIYKPVGYVSTVKDELNRKTVMDLVPQKLKSYRLYPVGRLDYDSEGLMLLTNDGDYAYQLTHPKFEIEKTYRVTVKGIPSERDIEKLTTGIWLTKRFKTAPAKLNCIQQDKGESIWEITIHEGKKRQVRRMFEAIHHPVKKLVRVKLGPYELGKLKPKESRLTQKLEIDL